MRIFNILGILCLLLLFGCGEEELEECLFADDGYFLLNSLDVRFDIYGELGQCQEFDATLIEVPSILSSGYLVLRDDEQNNLRFEQLHEMDWGKQLDSIQLGKTYHFGFWLVSDDLISGMKILDEGSLLYLAVSSSSMWLTAFYGCDFGPIDEKGGAFKGTELEGFTVEQLSESRCDPIEEIERDEYISLVTSLPVVFRYGTQTSTLYQSQESVFTTPYGDYLIHLLQSNHVEPQNYEDGESGYNYSFYVKRL